MTKFTYLGTLVVGSEIVHISFKDRTARYVTMNQAGNVSTYDETLAGNLPMRIAALRYLLESSGLNTWAHAIHPGLGGDQFFEDFRACRDALILTTQD